MVMNVGYYYQFLHCIQSAIMAISVVRPLKEVTGKMFSLKSQNCFLEKKNSYFWTYPWEFLIE